MKTLIIIFITFITLTNKSIAQTYNFYKVEITQSYMFASINISDTLKTGTLILSDYSVIIEDEQCVQIIEAERDYSGQLFSLTSKDIRYILNPLNNEFIIINKDIRTVYKLDNL